RESDSAFRFGGEEFAIILVESNKKDSMRYSQRLRNLIEKTDFEGFTITISVGCSEFKNKTDSPKSLVKRVDMALYKAKKRGRNGVCAL
ncbi:MAG: GGDEF domain-containing protein, partial [Elusimicrobiota bacterium]